MVVGSIKVDAWASVWVSESFRVDKFVVFRSVLCTLYYELAMVEKS